MASTLELMKRENPPGYRSVVERTNAACRRSELTATMAAMYPDYRTMPVHIKMKSGSDCESAGCTHWMLSNAVMQRWRWCPACRCGPPNAWKASTARNRCACTRANGGSLTNSCGLPRPHGRHARLEQQPAGHSFLNHAKHRPLCSSL